MNTQHVILDVEACVGDGEWERAQEYVADLRAQLLQVVQAAPTPQVAGAILQTLAGVEHAVEHHISSTARSGLRHLAYLVGSQAA